MPSTALGKRTRRVAEAEPVTRSTRRRIADDSSNNENANPFVRENTDCEHPATKPTRSSTRKGKAPAKSTRVEISPAKINGHFKAAKPIEVYQDGKNENIRTPQTNRFRDALSKKVPITPRHRVLVGGQLTPRTPKTPFTPSNAPSVYNDARRLFSRCSNPVRLVGRETEREEITTFIRTAAESTSGACLYVSGPPGTGKSALIDEVAQPYTELQGLKKSVVNCMSVRNAKDLSQKLSDDLGLDENAGFEYLKSCFVGRNAKSEQKYLVILDEVDRLVDLDLELLYSLFEWSMQSRSRLILIGIANALDLTDRFLPRLKSRCLKPDLLPFMPYNAPQIANVLKEKLKTLATDSKEDLPFLHPAAIQFCAKKVASQTGGDLRKAFDICRRAIDLVEQEVRDKALNAVDPDSPSKTPLMENINLSSPPTPRSPSKSKTTNKTNLPKHSLNALTHLSSLTPLTAPRATISHMAKITSQAFSNGTTQRLSTLNIQQKAVLCSLAALQKRSSTSTATSTANNKIFLSTPSRKQPSAGAPTVKTLYEAYTSLCKREKLLHALSMGEFRDVVGGLEGLGLVEGVEDVSSGMRTPSSGRGKKGGMGKGNVEERRVAGVVAYKELEGAVVEGKGGELLREILEGGEFL